VSIHSLLYNIVRDLGRYFFHKKKVDLFEDVGGVSIIGGFLDGQGTSLWDCKRTSESCPIGASVCVTFL
jgi:hypothetical protein